MITTNGAVRRLTQNDFLDREPSHDLEAELAVLGGRILNPEQTRQTPLTAAHFVDERCVLVFSALRAMEHVGRPIDVSAVAAQLKADGAFDDHHFGADGPAEFLRRCLDHNQAAPTRFPQYVACLEDVRQRRAAYNLFLTGMRLSHDRSLSTKELLSQSIGLLECIQDQGGATRPAIVSVCDLVAAHPKLRDPLIHGLLRRGETANIIAPSKSNKSWMTSGLALSVVTGAEWLGRFRCEPGRVLLIDNELHQDNLSWRMQTVADAMGIRLEDHRAKYDTWALRGSLLDLHAIADELRQVGPGRYDIVILDSLYRAMPVGTSENDNAAVTQLYNTIDGLTRDLGCAWVNVHHTSKGGQGEKNVTDVGAGAGAQSRAADTHLILRPHEDDGAVVLDGVVRSFPPIEPMGLRWQFPLWQADAKLDPRKVRGRQGPAKQKQQNKDRDATSEMLLAMAKEPQSVSQLRKVLGGAGLDRVKRLLSVLEAAGKVAPGERKGRGGEATVYRTTEAPKESGT